MATHPKESRVQLPRHIAGDRGLERAARQRRRLRLQAGKADAAEFKRRRQQHAIKWTILLLLFLLLLLLRATLLLQQRQHEAASTCIPGHLSHVGADMQPLQLGRGRQRVRQCGVAGSERKHARLRGLRGSSRCQQQRSDGGDRELATAAIGSCAARQAHIAMH